MEGAFEETVIQGLGKVECREISPVDYLPTGADGVILLQPQVGAVVGDEAGRAGQVCYVNSTQGPTTEVEGTSVVAGGLLSHEGAVPVGAAVLLLGVAGEGDVEILHRPPEEPFL